MKTFFKQIERIVVVIGVLLTFFAVLEVLRAYQTLHNFHPWAGYAFIFIICNLIGYLIWQIRKIFQFPSILIAPELPKEGEITRDQQQAYIKYLLIVFDRFSRNSIIQQDSSIDTTELAETGMNLNNVSLNSQEFRAKIEDIETRQIKPILEKLDKTAENIVSDNVGIVTLGTALSPYKSFDIYIVLIRNVRMVNNIIKIYRTRPTLKETFKVFYDIARVVTAINLLNATDQIWAGIGRHIPILGRWGEAAAEGIFSGLLTSVSGHAAIDRCRTYKYWSVDEAAKTYRGKMKRWGQDVLDIMKRHALDRLLHRGAKIESDFNLEDENSDDAEKLSSFKLSNLWKGKKSE